MGWFTKTAPTVYAPAAPDELEEERRRQILEGERSRAGQAHAAVERSERNVATERARLRDSKEIADALREQIRRNGFTERIRASMALREKGA